MKNCGSPIHEEVASKAFMDELREMVHKTTNDKVRAKILELTQTWAFAFRNTPKYRGSKNGEQSALLKNIKM